MAPNVALTYFDFDGAAEPVRMALAMTGQPWEDRRLTREQFLTIKPALPDGKLPVLDVDGIMFPQSVAQLRYAGKLAGLYPTDPLEAAFADAKYRLGSAAKNKTKMELRRGMTENFLPTWLSNLEKNLKLAGGQYFVSGKLSIGDIAIVARLLMLKSGKLDGIPATIVDNYPLLQALIERVCAEPRIAAYQRTKPKK